MKRSLIFGLVIALLALNLAIGAQIYLTSAHVTDGKDAADPNMQLFDEVLDKVRNEYVDGKNLTYRELVYAALKGMVGKLDPHSEFMDADDYQQLQDDTEGQFGGLGLVVAMKDNFSPSWRRWTIRRGFAREFCPVTASSRSTARARKKRLRKSLNNSFKTR